MAKRSDRGLASSARGGCLRGVALLAVLVVAAALAAPLIPLDHFKPQVESRLSRLLGSKVSVGSVRFSVLRGPAIEIKGMTAREDSTFGEGSVLEADTVRAGLAMVPLVLHRQLAVQRIQFKGATLKLADRSSRSSSAGDTVYKDLELDAYVRPSDDGSSGSHATGTFRARSEESDGAEKLGAEMPFDLLVGKGRPNNLSLKGAIGPGNIETKNFAAQNFKSSIELNGKKATLDQIEADLYDGTLHARSEIDMTGSKTRFSAEGDVQNLNIDQSITSKLDIAGQITGHLNSKFKLSGDVDSLPAAMATVSGAGQASSDDLFVSGLNLSTQVARALKVDQIGDMSPGTRIGHIETGFQIAQGQIDTSNVRVERVAGLGDAASAQGRITVSERNGKSSVSMDIPATITMSTEAMERVKSAMPLIGAAMSLLANGNRVTIPITIRGDVRNPQVQVDVLGFRISGGG
jgi:hypothetical protein